jgi:perosamine synthetase
MCKDLIKFVQSIYKSKDFIALHEPCFNGNEKKYLNECIDSTFVSSVGKFVDEFENKFACFIGTKYAVAVSNGTAALHISLLLADVQNNDEVITQPLTFVATCNAISYCGAVPVFVDVDKNTLGLSPEALAVFLKENTSIKNNQCINNITGKVIKACVPMHTFGHPCEIDKIKNICEKHFIFLIEDAAESVGSRYKDRHTGSFGKLGIMSFNGNKIITSGGGGCIVTNDEALARRAKHLTTTAKVPHKWDFNHDQIGYNYRMPNINASLLVAQLEYLDKVLIKKRHLAKIYEEYIKLTDFGFVKEPINCESNYWLNAVILKDRRERDKLLLETNQMGVMTRPIWMLMNKLPMYKNAQCGNLANSYWLEDRVVNLPSSVKL